LSNQNPINDLSAVFPTIGAQRVKRLAITRVKAETCLFNVTSSNDTVYWTCFPRPGDSVYESTYAITIPQGFYSIINLVDTFVTVFNITVNPAVGTLQATLMSDTNGLYRFYTYRVNPGSPLPSAFINSYTNTVTPVVNNKNGVSNALNEPWGLGLPGINFNDQVFPLSSLQAVHWARPLSYGPRYFDICSQALTMDSKTMNPDLRAPGDSIARVFLESPLPHQIDKTWQEPLNWINVEDRPLTNVDLRIVIDKYSPMDTNDWPNSKEISRVNLDVEVTIEF
jgi:hypothetical protein